MPKPRKSSKHSSVPQAQPGPWTEWTPSPPENQRAGLYYRARERTPGDWQYEFNDDPYGASSLQNDYTPYDTPEEPYSKPHETPRDPEEELANSLNTLDLDGVGNDDPEPLSSPIYTTDAGKGKGLAEPEPDDGEGYTSDTPTEGTAGDIAEGTGNLVDGLDESIFRQSLQSGMTGHGSSSAPYGQDPGYNLPGGTSYGAPEESAYGPAADELAQAEDSDSVEGTPVSHEALDSRYRIYKSKYWTPGTVFKIYWSEPMGSNGALSVSNKQVYAGEFGSFYTGFRRFIVVASDEGNSTCVPVATYGGQGCRKNGVKASKHGLILAQSARSKTKPKAPKNIEALGFPSVRMIVTTEGETLSPASRINYSKLVTIEHNCKILMIGQIDKAHFQNFADAVDSCWIGKKHYPPGYMNTH